MDIVKFIEKNAVLHDGSVRYNDNRKSISVATYPFGLSHHRGVYFFVLEHKGKKNIMKVGKADGKKGFAQRISEYRYDQSTAFKNKRTDCLVTYEAFKEMRKKFGDDVKLQMWLYRVDPQLIEHKGITVEASIVRDLELTLSKLARQQGHDMLLSRVD